MLTHMHGLPCILLDTADCAGLQLDSITYDVLGVEYRVTLADATAEPLATVVNGHLITLSSQPQHVKSLPAGAGHQLNIEALNGLVILLLLMPRTVQSISQHKLDCFLGCICCLGAYAVLGGYAI